MEKWKVCLLCLGTNKKAEVGEVSGKGFCGGILLHLSGHPRAARCGPNPAASPGHQVRRLGWDLRAGMHQKDKVCETSCKITSLSRQSRGCSESPMGEGGGGAAPALSTELLCLQSLLPLPSHCSHHPPPVSIAGSFGQSLPTSCILQCLRTAQLVIFPF